MSRKTCKKKADDDETLILRVRWYEDRQRWISGDDHDFGIVAEAETRDALIARIVRMTPFLMDYSSAVQGHA